MTTGDLKAGLQTGYCTDTGGGWSRMMLAHRSQLHRIPDSMEDDVAVLLEPFACAIHAALRANVPDGGSVFVVGAGTVGILTLLAVKLLTRADHVIVAAKHPAQRVAARLAGADVVVVPEHAVKAVRRSEHAMKLTPERGMDFLLGGVDVAIESTGSKSALDLALRTTKAGGPGRPERHPRAGRRPDAGVVPRAGARRRLHERDRARRRRRPTDDGDGDRAGERPAHARRHGRRDAIRSTGGARRSITRSAPAGSARSRWRSRRKRPDRQRPRREDRCPDPDSCWRSTNGPRPCWCTRGRGSACRRFPLGSRVVYPPDSLPGIKDVNAAIRHALLNPIDAEPLPELLTRRA